MKIYLGPAGIPTVCKGGSTIEGIKTVSELGLNALEVEFVRGVHMSNQTAKETGKVAKDLGILLSIHAPYYINLISPEIDKVDASKKRILDSFEKAHLMGANVVVVHAGYYGKRDKEYCFEEMKKEIKDLMKMVESRGFGDVLLGLETTGKMSQWGTLDEIVRMGKEIKKCVPVLDSAHIFARQAGKIDYDKLFDKIEELRLKHLNCHFSGIKWSPAGQGGGNERYHVEISSNQPPFEPLAKEILKRKIDTTIISESPILEQDSLRMKKVFEKLGYRD